MIRSKRPTSRHERHVEASGWTANSDLFMGVAVVFLIMFVFALLSSGASQISLQKEKMEAQKYLLGQIPEAEKIQTQNDLDQATRELKDMAEKREILSASLTQLAQMAATMESREKSLKNLYETNSRNIARIEQTQGIVDKQAKELQEQKRAYTSQQKQFEVLEQAVVGKDNEISKLREDLAAISKERSQLQGERDSLSKNQVGLKEEKAQLAKAVDDLRSQSQAVEKLQKELAGLRAENKDLKAQNGRFQKQNEKLSQENDSLGSDLKSSKKEWASLGEDFKNLQGSFAGQSKELQRANGEIGKLKGRLAGAEGDNGRLLAANGDLGGALKKGRVENEGLGSKIKDLENKLKNAQKKNDQQEKQLAVVMADKNDLDREAKDLGERLAQLDHEGKKMQDQLNQSKKAVVACEDEKSKAKDQQKVMALAAKSQKDKLGEVANTLADARKAAQDIDSERKNIASAIAGNLKASGVEVDVNPETGNITLRMDESFYFKNASYELRDEAKQKISQIMPVYAQSLLGKAAIAKRIESIVVTGYASPKFNKQYFDPATTTGEPYDYNLELSINRAKEIASYMFGKEISDYPFKDKLRAMVNVSGVGMMKAIPLANDSICSKDPNAASKFEECSCGPYDCKRSRRVELQFVLKNQKDSDRQLQKIFDKLNDKDNEHVSH